ncbi:MAG: hypothetical protein INR64_12875 [Caulobacteraceae bacterium]|nr:hypothetical protein [Caulobacter sp.]
MSALGRFFARLLGRRPEPRPQPMSFAPAEAAPAPLPLEPVAEAGAPAALPLSEAPFTEEPRSELAFTPAIGAAAGEADVLAAQAGVELVGDDAPTAEDEEDVFEEEERPDDVADEERARGVDLDDKIAMREAAIPYLRSVAEEEALTGERRVRPTDPSGPGTLAEALTRLEAEGRVTCELGEDEAGAPVLVYRPTA